VSTLDTIRRWLFPVLGPFGELPTHLNAIQQNHLASLNSLEGIIGSLVETAPPDQAFVGTGANELIETVENYLRSERILSGGGTSVLDEIEEAVTTYGEDLEEAAENLETQTGGAEGITAVFLILALADVLQAGLDIFTDAITAVLGVIMTALYFAALVAFGWALFEATQTLINKLSQIGSQPQPSLPPHQASQTPPYNSLTPEQEKLADKLHQVYGPLGLSLDDIRKIIEENPNLTEAQLRQLLAQYASVTRANPNLVKKYGALQVFLVFTALSAYDPAHKGNYPTRTPVADQDLSKRMEEAETLLGAAEAGDLPWPLTPSTDPRYEATDANNQKWDVKAWRSGMKPRFNVNKALTTIQDEVGKGENVLINDTYMSVKDRDDLNQAIKAAGLESHVIWWPVSP
jgi:hypothetical protein